VRIETTWRRQVHLQVSPLLRSQGETAKRCFSHF